MNFDKTSPKKRNPQQQEISRNATKKQSNCAGKPPNWQIYSSVRHSRSCLSDLWDSQSNANPITVECKEGK